MKFIYSPEGAEKQEFPFDPDRLMTSEAEAIESATGMSFGEWREAVMREHSKAQRAFLWVMLKRARPTLKFHEVEFRMGEVAIDLDEEELGTVLTELEKFLEGKDPTPDQQEVLDELRAARAQNADPAVVEPVEDVEPAEPNGDDAEGKALKAEPASPQPDAVTTNGPSPTA